MTRRVWQSVAKSVAVFMGASLAFAVGCGRSVVDDDSNGDSGTGAAGAGGGGTGGGSGAGGSAFGGTSGTGATGGSGTGASGGIGGGPGCGPCAGCCDPAGICRPGNDINACGDGNVPCLDCGALGFACLNGACEGTAPPCGPGTCNGCCTAAGLCRFGTETDACGTGGQACEDCGPSGQGCVNSACMGPAPTCGPGNCGGCCTAAGQCQPGTSNAACGQAGASCQSCTASGTTCTQPGNYCAFFPACGPFTCPAGCCDASGQCKSGQLDKSCGSAGQACKDCSATGQACAASGFCYSGPHCGPDNCGGCCTANGTCVTGSSSDACGLFGKLCDNCSTKGQSCVAQACSSGSTCPAAYPGCSPDALTPPPVASSSCSAQELSALAAACQGSPPGPGCGQYYQTLLTSNPQCYGCLLQFTTDSAYSRCLAPFLTPSCNHDLTCALFCSNGSCNQCSPGQDPGCRQQVFEQGGQCASWVNGYYCAQAALSGPGAFCEFSGNAGQWIAKVGGYYCGK
ncbi:MAG: hypothetical protein KF718_09345 [Polyangiaceae bacterium]|nr:hypothetical protein [Polyangiaceae bacterium]